MGGCSGLCITSSSEVSATNHHIFGVATSCLLQAKHILNVHYSRGSFPPYPYYGDKHLCKCYSVMMHHCYHYLLHCSAKGRAHNCVKDFTYNAS